MSRLTLLAIVGLALLWIGSEARADDGVAERHLRLRTKHGAVHVWTPAGFDRDTAATVIYVHGYFANVDDAWTDYRLADQFRASGLNAMFIACEAPTSERDDVAWPALRPLLDVVQRRAGPLPAGRLIAMGHSGAHRTLVRWLDEPDLDTIALVDAAYGDLDVYARWLEARDDRRLIDVGDLMRDATDAFHARLPDTVVIERFPAATCGTLPPEALDARIVYVRSRMGHMQLVTEGRAIPMLLRALDAPLLHDLDRSDPIRLWQTKSV